MRVDCNSDRFGLAMRAVWRSKWPVPHGLVRAGIAPDHAADKRVADEFDRTLLVRRSPFDRAVATRR